MIARSLVLVLVLASSAHAQPEDRGRLHFQAGASYYEAGDYNDALREFQRAYELSQKPELFYNLSLCHQQLGDLDQATSFLERYLGEVEDVPNRANLQRRLENFRERMAQREQNQNQEQEQEQEQEPTESGGVSPLLWTGIGVGGAGLVTLAVSGGLALSEKGNLEGRGCPESGDRCDSGSLKTRSIVADIGLGLTVVGVTLGVVGLIMGGSDDDPDAQARVRVDPYAGPESAGAIVRGTF